MIVLKYEKSGDSCFISHIDWLRHVSRILRRADIPVNYSQGFNPHALVFFSPPLAVGVASEAEYLAIDTVMSADEVMARYNASVLPSLRASEVFVCDKNPNLQAKITAADYVFETPYRNIELGGGFEIEYRRKGQTVKENVADKIFEVFDCSKKLAMRLAAGNNNLRPDRILKTLNSILGTSLSAADVKKTAQYFSIDGKYVDADDILKNKL